MSDTRKYSWLDVQKAIDDSPTAMEAGQGRTGALWMLALVTRLAVFQSFLEALEFSPRKQVVRDRFFALKQTVDQQKLQHGFDPPEIVRIALMTQFRDLLSE